MAVKLKPIDLRKIDFDQEMSAFGVAACLREMGYRVTGYGVMRFPGVPHRRGYFTRFYTLRSVADWLLAGGEARVAGLERDSHRWSEAA